MFPCWSVIRARRPRRRSADCEARFCFRLPDVQPKVIAVVSSIATEGKTTVTANLGVSFAQRGESVLMIDGDLRRSSLHTQFGLPLLDAGNEHAADPERTSDAGAAYAAGSRCRT